MSKFDLGAIMTVTQVKDPAERTIETVTEEILELKKTAGEAIIGIGQRLIEAKTLLPHGEWLPWLAEKVDFSERHAQNFMRLAREWSNPQSLADLGAAKALALLALPAEEREQFMSESHEVDGEEKSVIDMTSRQLEQAIKERDEARLAAEAAKADAITSEASRRRMEEDLKVANELLARAKEDRDKAEADVSSLRNQLETAKAAPVEVAVMEVDQAAIDQAKAEAVAEIQAELVKTEEAKKKATEKLKAAEEAKGFYQERVEELEKRLKRDALTADKDMAAFEVLFNQGQELANKMQGLLIKARGRGDQTVVGVIQRAMNGLADAIRGGCGMSNWYEQAERKLTEEGKEVSGQKEMAMKKAVKDMLLEFSRQDEEFARAVVQGGSFADCMEKVAKGVGTSISDLEAYKKAVSFYFPGAGIKVTMKIDLCDSVKDAPHPDGPGILLDLADFL